MGPFESHRPRRLHLAYETTVPTRCYRAQPRLEGKVLVMQEKLSFGIGLAVVRVSGQSWQYHLSLNVHAGPQ